MGLVERLRSMSAKLTLGSHSQRQNLNALNLSMNPSLHEMKDVPGKTSNSSVELAAREPEISVLCSGTRNPELSGRRRVAPEISTNVLNRPLRSL